MTSGCSSWSSKAMAMGQREAFAKAFKAALQQMVSPKHSGSCSRQSKALCHSSCCPKVRILLRKDCCEP